MAGIRVLIPDDAEWRKISEKWGNAEFIVALERRGNQGLVCPGQKVVLQVRTPNGDLPLARRFEPVYGYSMECRDYGWPLSTSPGGMASLILSFERGEIVAETDLVVLASWKVPVKDRLAGEALREQLRGIVDGLALVGILAIGVAGVAAVRLKLRARRHPV